MTPEPLFEGRPASYWVAQLQDLSPDFRAQARHAIRQFGASAVPALLSALPEDPFQDGGPAFGMLVELRGAATKPLVAALEDPSRAAVWHLIASILAHIGAPAVPALIEPGRDLGEFALAALRDIGPPAEPAIPLLERMLTVDTSTESYGKANIISVLGSIGGAAACSAPAIAVFLNHTDAHLRETAAHALSRFGAEALPHFQRELSSGDLERQCRAVRWLHLIKEDAAPAIPDLCEFLEQALAPEEVRRAAIDLIGALGPMSVEAVPTLINELCGPEDADQLTLEAAALALGWIGEEAVAALPELAALVRGDEYCSEEARIAAIDSMKAIGIDEEAMAALISALEDEIAPMVREWAAEALGELGGAARPALPTLAQLLGDDDTDLVEASLIAICRIGPEPSLGGRLIDALASPNTDLRIAATKALGRLGREVTGARQALTGRLRDEALPVRNEALQGLVSIGAGQDAVAPLVELLENEDHCLLAAYVLGNMGRDATYALPELLVAMESAPDDAKEVMRLAVESILRAGKRPENLGL